jgi:exodeoxyribonuclease-3
VRIATWNINGIKPRFEHLTAWLKAASPDVLCLQELKCTADEVPSEELAELGYETAAHTTGRWNGVAILSRVGLTDVVHDLREQPGFLADGELHAIQEPRAIGATCGGMRLWSLYIPNGRTIDHPHYQYKLEWLAALRGTVSGELAPDRPFALLGDFNIAPTDEDVWDISKFTESTHVTEPERAALAALRDEGLTDIYPRPLKYDVPFTYWDYRQLSFPKNTGMRIDLVYGDAAFAAKVKDAYVDREARKGKTASDHAPVVVDLES